MSSGSIVTSTRQMGGKRAAIGTALFGPRPCVSVALHDTAVMIEQLQSVDGACRRLQLRSGSRRSDPPIEGARSPLGYLTYTRRKNIDSSSQKTKCRTSDKFPSVSEEGAERRSGDKFHHAPAPRQFLKEISQTQTRSLSSPTRSAARSLSGKGEVVRLTD
jgi:hypothetical protein